MGAVHGVHLKYVAAAGVSGALAISLPFDELPLCVLLLAYATVTYLLVAVLFVFRMGMWLIGKSTETGQVPTWSLAVWSPFHLFNWLYTSLSVAVVKSIGTDMATEVHPGWWIGGRYGAQLQKKWALTIDLTCEFPEGCRATSLEYLLLPCWDGVPPSPEQIERAAKAAARCSKLGEIMVHCAHGRGRSTTVMVACLVRAGFYPDWQEAFEAVKRKRPVVALNKKMRTALMRWQQEYGAGVASPRSLAESGLLR